MRLARILALFCALPTSAWAAGQLAQLAAPGETVTVTLQADAFHDECMPLTAGDKLVFEFTASALVEFHIHYHVGDRAFYPRFPQEARVQASTFRARSDQAYCMTWTNLQEAPVSVTYTYDVAGRDVSDETETETR